MSKRSQQTSFLLETFDIARYAVLIEDEEIYRKAIESICSVFYEYIDFQLKDNDANNNVISFNDEQTDLMKLVLNMTCKEQRNFFNKDCFLISIWYNPVKYIPLSDDSRNFIWFFLTNIIEANKEEWFMSYWTFADQYYRFQLDGGKLNFNRRHDETYLNQQKVFKEFHIALGALLLYKKKYSWMKKIMYFTQVSPAQYMLMLNTLSEIFDSMEMFDKLLDKPLQCTRKYMMSGLTNDINTDSYIMGRINAYLAMLTVRLGTMDYNVSYCDPYEIPSINNNATIQELENKIRYTDVLTFFLTDKDFKEEIKLLEFENEEYTEGALNSIDEYRNALKEKIESIRNNPITDPDKIAYIKNRLSMAIENSVRTIPNKTESALDTDIHKDFYLCRANIQVPIEDIAKFTSRLSVNMEEVLISMLMEQELKYYNYFFLQNHPVKTYTIRYKDLMQALENLKLDSNFVILSFGVDVSANSSVYGKHPLFVEKNDKLYFYDARIIYIHSNRSFLAIVPKHSLPYMEHIKFDNSEEQIMECIDDNLKLYSNVDKLSTTQQDLTVLWKTMLVSSKSFTRYIMLNIKYNTDSSIFDIDNIEDIKTFIKFC